MNERVRLSTVHLEIIAVVLQGVQLRALFALCGVLTRLLRVATGGRIGIVVGRFDGRTERETRLTGLFRMETTEE